MMRYVRHSQGMVVQEVDVAVGNWSFIVDKDGNLTEMCGWHHAGPVPHVEHNPPANVEAVLTVAVETSGRKLNDSVLVGLCSLFADHRRIHGECSVWPVQGGSKELRNWIHRGCVPPRPVDVDRSAEESDEDAGDDTQVDGDGGGWDTDDTDDDDSTPAPTAPEVEAADDKVPGVTHRQVAPARPRKTAAEKARAKKVRAEKVAGGAKKTSKTKET